MGAACVHLSLRSCKHSWLMCKVVNRLIGTKPRHTTTCSVCSSLRWQGDHAVEMWLSAGRLVEKCPAEIAQETSALLHALMETEWGYDWSPGLFGIGSMVLDDDEYSDDDGGWGSDDGGWDDAGGDATAYEPNKSDYVRGGALKVQFSRLVDCSSPMRIFVLTAPVKVVMALLKSRSDLLRDMLEKVEHSYKLLLPRFTLLYRWPRLLLASLHTSSLRTSSKFSSRHSPPLLGELYPMTRGSLLLQSSEQDGKGIQWRAYLVSWCYDRWAPPHCVWVCCWH